MKKYTYKYYYNVHKVTDETVRSFALGLAKMKVASYPQESDRYIIVVPYCEDYEPWFAFDKQLRCFCNPEWNGTNWYFKPIAEVYSFKKASILFGVGESIVREKYMHGHRTKRKANRVKKLLKYLNQANIYAVYKYTASDKTAYNRNKKYLYPITNKNGLVIGYET